MKTLEAIEQRIIKLGGQKRAVALRLVHLQKSFETHNDRVDAGGELYKVYFEQLNDEILATITNQYEENDDYILTI